MNCTRCEALMSDYLEGTISREDGNAVSLHLQTCRACNELLAGIADVVKWGKTFPIHTAPVSLSMRIVACTNCEERMSDYLEGALIAADRSVVEAHLESCTACSELMSGMSGVVEWGKSFPAHEPPVWLAPRIIANTPHVARESWVDTIAVAWKWLVDPRTAMGVFTAVLVLGWMGNVAGISPDWATVVRNPSSIYYEAQGAVNRAYDEAVRRYYRSPIVSGIRSRIEQLREIS